MAKYNNNNGSHGSSDIINLLFEELKSFRSENREDYKKLENVLTDQNRILDSHSEQLIRLAQTVHGNGNKGLVDRIDDIEKTQKAFAEKIADIETREKVRAAVLGAICAVCSSIGGVITYLVSVYISIHK
jgi:deferrochelatase/peroxidase EfeB